jgi:hypothetical protein
MITRLVPAAALLGALLLLPSPASAQDDVTLTMARERFKEGVAYFDKKDFAKARVAFLQAYALKKHPAVLLNLAQSELRSGHEADAAKHFAQYLREHKDATDAERQGAETGLTAAKALVAELTLEVDTSGAEVYVDGDLEGQAPLPGSVYLSPGQHTIEAKKDGKSAKQDVNASAGQSSSLSLKLAASTRKRPVGAPAGDSGGETGGEVSSDTAPDDDDGVATQRKGFGAWLVSTPSAMITTGLAGVGIIGGAAFALGSKASYDAANGVQDGIESNALTKDLKDNGPTGICGSKGTTNSADIDAWLLNHARAEYDDPAARKKKVGEYVDNCNKYEDNVESGDTFKKLAIVSFAVGGAAAIGTVIYYIVDSKEPASAKAPARRRVVVTPIYEPGYAGAIVSGSF